MTSIQQSGKNGSRNAPGPDESKKTQSDNSLSRTSGAGNGDGRFSVAEEVNLDQQGDQARGVGQMPQDAVPGASSAASPSEAMSESMKPEKEVGAKDRRT